VRKLSRHRRLAAITIAVGTAAGLSLAAWSATRAASQPAGVQAMLAAHNAYRSKHCVPGLGWSAQIAASAQQWASRCSFSHQQGSGYGENLAWGTNLQAAQAAAMWYNEAAKYNYAKPGFSGQTGHFTQVVWRSSRQVGCGMAVCNRQNYWVCRYSPPGNITGQFPANVPKACGK
jgi:uncharacterized protein YkwD